VFQWWNFIGRTHSEIVGFRADWESARRDGGGGRFGAFPGQWSHTLPAPELPNVRLR
jgi:hypothetical protein